MLWVAKALLGKLLVAGRGRNLVAGRIVETEAYRGVTDRASHAYGNRRTARTEIMYHEGGVAYVYLCYGMHHLFNVVTGKKDVPEAVLVRAIEPVHGRKLMLARSGRASWHPSIGSGPGNVTKAMGIHFSQSGTDMQGDDLFIADDGWQISEHQYATTPRIGVDYAGPDATLPYRFIIRDHPQISAKTFTNKFLHFGKNAIHS